jgi:hypothetical protein
MPSHRQPRDAHTPVDSTDVPSISAFAEASGQWSSMGQGEPTDDVQLTGRQCGTHFRTRFGNPLELFH